MEPVWILTASSVLMVALLIRAVVRGPRKRASRPGASADGQSTETRYTVYLSDGRGFKNVTIVGTVTADITAENAPHTTASLGQPTAHVSDEETPDEVMLVLQQASGRQIRVRQSAVRLIQPS